jgi:hypothetical protein
MKNFIVMDYYTIFDDSNGNTKARKFSYLVQFLLQQPLYVSVSARNSLKSVLLTASEKATVQNNFTVHT